MENSTKFITLKQWAINKFGFAPCSATLSAYAKNNQIYPPPKKFGGRWMCASDAEYFDLPPANENLTNNPMVRRIINGG